MKNIALYALTVLIWGTTWLAVEYQLGDVAVSVSLFYRFAIAAFCIWCICLIRGIPLYFALRDHFFIALLALANFSINYTLLYWTQKYLSSAMTSIAFSTMLLMNIVNSRIFFGTRIAHRIYIGAIIGVLGLVALFWHDLMAAQQSDNTLLGLSLALSGTLFASFGNMVAVRNSHRGLNIFAVNAWGMFYGATALGLFALSQDMSFNISSKPSYLFSLLYLATFGTVIAFSSYFVLLKNLGTERASYAMVLFPVIAVCLSTLFEGFVWHTSTFIGFSMVILGNIIVLTPARLFNKLLRQSNNA